jgi:hypothetical protein
MFLLSPPLRAFTQREEQTLCPICPPTDEESLNPETQDEDEQVPKPMEGATLLVNAGQN